MARSVGVAVDSTGRDEPVAQPRPSVLADVGGPGTELKSAVSFVSASLNFFHRSLVDSPEPPLNAVKANAISEAWPEAALLTADVMPPPISNGLSGCGSSEQPAPVLGLCACPENSPIFVPSPGPLQLSLPEPALDTWYRLNGVLPQLHEWMIVEWNWAAKIRFPDRPETSKVKYER